MRASHFPPIPGSIVAISQGTVITPSGDQAGVKDSANINAVTEAGGAALLQSGQYYVSNILIDSLGTLMGVGRGTVINVVSGTTGYAVALKNPASTYQVSVRNLTIKPNTGSVGGVSLDNTAFTSGGGETDSLHTLEDVFVIDAGGNAFNLGANIRSLRASRCAAYTSGGYGWNIASGTTDSFFTSCVSGVSANHAWNIAGWNNMFSSCKGFYGGYSGSFGMTGCGFEITGQFNTLASCSAQTNALHGFDLQSCVSCTIAACEADTNGAGAGTTGAGVNTNATTDCIIAGVTGGTAGGETQTYGIQVAGTQTGTAFVFNAVTGTTGQLGYVSGGSYTYLGTGTVDLSAVSAVKLLSGTQFGSGAQLYSGSGAPNIGGSPAGSYYLRTDTPSTANQRIYVATGTNTWSGIA